MKKYYNDRVDILLPTYNGEKYLYTQILSLLNQTYSNIHLYVRDDGSTDKTLGILQKIHKKYPQKVSLIQDSLGNLGVANNVFTLMKYSRAQYIMLADQDDVWRRNKVQILLKRIKEKERQYKRIPLLISSDSYVTDEDLRIISHSFLKYEGLNKKRIYFSNLLQRNVVQGSASIFNRQLLVQALKGYPIEMTYHDGWLSLVAAAYGKIFWCSKKLMYYRQHADNVLGANRSAKLWHWLWTGERDYEIRVIHYLMINRDLCRKFKTVYDDSLPKTFKYILDYYIERPNGISEFLSSGLFLQYNILDILLRISQGIYG